MSEVNPLDGGADDTEMQMREVKIVRSSLKREETHPPTTGAGGGGGGAHQEQHTEKKTISIRQMTADYLKDEMVSVTSVSTTEVSAHSKHTTAERLSPPPPRITSATHSTSGGLTPSVVQIDSPQSVILKAPTSSYAHGGDASVPHPNAGTDTARARRRALARKALTSEFDFLAVPEWVRLHPLLGAYLAEATGTFFFVLTVALVTINNPGTKGMPETNITCIPIGFMLMCMVFTFGYISGGHFNPAVTVAVAVAGKMDKLRALGYILCQCAASLGAGIVAMIIQGSNDIVVPDVQNNSTYIRKGIFAELIYTFALATVVLNVAYSRQQGNFFYGFAIGMTIVAGVSAVGGVSGGAFNPALATGLQAAVCLIGRCQPLMHFWLYWLSPLIGAVVATILFMQMWQPSPEDREVNV